MPWLMWHGRDAEIIDLSQYRLKRGRCGPVDLEEIDSTLRRVMMHLHPDWTEKQFQIWLAEWDEDWDEDTG